MTTLIVYHLRSDIEFWEYSTASNNTCMIHFANVVLFVGLSSVCYSVLVLWWLHYQTTKKLDSSAGTPIRWWTTIRSRYVYPTRVPCPVLGEPCQVYSSHGLNSGTTMSALEHRQIALEQRLSLFQRKFLNVGVPAHFCRCSNVNVPAHLLSMFQRYRCSRVRIVDVLARFLDIIDVPA